MKVPSIQFYPADWRKDPGVQALTYEERGIWIEILFLMHESEERGKLTLNGKPIDEKRLGQLLHLSEKKIKISIKNLLDLGVASIESETGILINRRMIRDEAMLQSKRLAGSLGGNPNLQKGKANPYYLDNQTDKQEDKQKITTIDKQKITPSITSSSSSSSSITTSLSLSNKDSKTLAQPPKKKDTTSSLTDSFDMFYTAYPKHVGKDAALKAWKKLNPTDSLLQTILQAIANAKETDNWKKDRQFIPYPATWLNGKRWEDEITTGHETQPPVPEALSKDSVLKWSQYSDSIIDFDGNCIQPGKEHIVQALEPKCYYKFCNESPRTAEQWDNFILTLDFVNPTYQRS